MHSVSHCMYFTTRNKRFLAGSVIKLMNSQVKLEQICFLLMSNLKVFFLSDYSDVDHAPFNVDDEE